MKKQFLTVALVAMMSLSAQQMQAQSVLGNILGKVVSAATGATSTDDTESSGSSSALGGILSGISSVISSSKTATADQLVGTWTYTEPAVMFTSSNVLNNVGGKVASAAIEKKLNTKLSKYGIKKGLMTMTFDKNGNFTQTLKKKTLKGTYAVEGKQVVLTYTGGVQQMVGTTQVDGSSLVIVMDATKLLGYVQTLGSLTSNSTLQAASTLIGGMDGMQCGLRLQK